MPRHPSAPHLFRPRLEHLETRELPSGAGTVVTNLLQPLTPLTQQMAGQVHQLTLDFNQLQTDVANSPFVFPDALTANIAIDYTKVANDYGQVQSLNAVITSTVKVDQTVIFVGIADGLFDDEDVKTVLDAMKFLKSVTNTAAENLAQAVAIANTDPGNGFPTIASQLHS